MPKRIRNVVIFAAAVLGIGLLIIGITALIDGDSSGWRAVIGSTVAIALAVSVGLRSRNAARRPDV